MKKYILITAILVAVLAAAGIAGYAYAQRPVPNTPFEEGVAQGWGMFGRMGGMRGAGMMENYERGSGPLHNYMVNAFAKALNLTAEDLDTRLQNGESMWQVAEAQGMTAEDFTALMTTVRTDAAQQAAADGVITQEQADWMLQRMQNMQQRGFGVGNCPMAGGATRNFSGRGPWNRQP